MTDNTFNILQQLGYKGAQDESAQNIINWLSTSDILRIEPYWHFLGADGGFTWSKSWDVFSEKREVTCESWNQLLDIALDESLKEAFPINE